MLNQVISGNAHAEGATRGGWFLGHFIPTDDPRATSDLEIKWGIHKAGDSRSEWSMNAEATTISILISGRFRLQFPEQDIVLFNQGDYVIWAPGVAHCWSAELDSTILTVRWPSKSGDSIATSEAK